MMIFFFNDTATTEIYTLSLHDALPISPLRRLSSTRAPAQKPARDHVPLGKAVDRKSTRLNSSHVEISYAVFCLKKKKFFGTIEKWETSLYQTDRSVLSKNTHAHCIDKK